MKFNNNTPRFNALVLGGLLMFSLPSLAASGDATQPIHINSTNQSLDMAGNVATFTGKVVITRGSIKIEADRVVVNRLNGDSKKMTVDAYGSPATFYQMQDNGKPVKGNASKLHYDLSQDTVELTGNAHIQQLDSNINGERITYSVKAQKMQASSSGQAKRVTTVLVPTQLQDNKAPNHKQSKSE